MNSHLQAESFTGFQNSNFIFRFTYGRPTSIFFFVNASLKRHMRHWSVTCVTEASHASLNASPIKTVVLIGYLYPDLFELLLFWIRIVCNLKLDIFKKTFVQVESNKLRHKFKSTKYTFLVFGKPLLNLLNKKYRSASNKLVFGTRQASRNQCRQCLIGSKYKLQFFFVKSGLFFLPSLFFVSKKNLTLASQFKKFIFGL